MAVQGCLDRFDNTIAGWAYDPAHPGQALDIIVEHNGQEIYRSKANLYRSDLLDAIGECDHGFSFDLLVANPEANELDLVILACASERKILGQGFWKATNVAVEGKDGWLFLNVDSNDVNSVISGKTIIDEAKLQECALLFASRSAMMTQLDIPYECIIMPEKNVACAGLRHNSVVSNTRPVIVIQSKAAQYSCAVQYPIEDFIEGANYFHKTDTHANAAGYRLLINLLKKNHPSVFCDYLLPEPILNMTFCGDLGNKFSPNRFEQTTEYLFPEDSKNLYVDNPVPEILEKNGTLRGSVVTIRNLGVARGKILVFGTSSAYGFLPLLSHLFSDILFLWENTFDYGLIKKYNPDFVLSLISERFLPISCNDLQGISI